MKLPHHRWFSFSLRSSFIAMTVGTAVAYWLARPTLLAHEFAEAVAARHYAKAESLFVERDDLPPFPRRYGDAEQLRNMKVSIEPISWSQLLRRQRRIYVYIPHGDEPLEFDWEITITARTDGLMVGVVMS